MLDMLLPLCRWLALLCCLASWPVAADEQPGLVLQVSGAQSGRFDLAQLRDRLQVHTISFDNPLMGKTKRYRAFALSDLLTLAYGERWQSDSFSDIAFIAVDGYEAVAPLRLLGNPGGYLAFEDLDVGDGWEPITKGSVDPGPLFLVWTGPDQTPRHGYPWPWQIAALNLLRFADQYPALAPDGAAGPEVMRGFDLFRQRCLRCHAINGQGGRVGPDLNAPQSITSYRSETMIKAFIQRPSQFRHSQMPDHTDLSAAQLDELYRYLWTKGHAPPPR